MRSVEDPIYEGREALVVSLVNNGLDSSLTLTPKYALVTIIDDDELPGVPTGLTVESETVAAIELSWTAPGDDGGKPITGYLVEVASDAAGPWTTAKAHTGSATATYIHTGLTHTTTYHYRVSAITAAGTGKPSTTMSGTTAALPVMTIGVALSNGNPVTSVDEAEPAPFVILRAGDTSEALTVNLEWIQDGGTAVAATDEFDIGDTSVSHDLPTRDNVVDEPDGTIALTLKAGDRYTLGATTSATITVLDDDEPQWALTALPATIAENGGRAEVRVASGGVTFLAAQEIGLTFAGSAAKDTDYSVAAETLTLAVGATAVATTITATDDSVADGDKTIEISAGLDGAQIGTTATVTITDDERPSTKVTLSVTPDTVAEGAGATGLTVTGTLDGAARSAATEVALAVSDGTAATADYGATTATLTIAATQTSGMATLTLTPVDDHVEEPNEAVSVGGTVTGGALTVTPTTVTITDNDEPLWALTALPATIAEDGGTTEVQVASGGVTFLAPRAIGLTFAGSAAKDADYGVAAETLTLAVGATAVATTITATDDNVVDADETIEISASLDGARIGTTATVTITDDEIPSTMVTLSVTPDTVAEDAGATELTVTGTLDRDARSEATEVALAVSDGTAAAADYGATTATLTIDAAQTSGMATLTLTPVDDHVDEQNETVSVGGTVTGGGLTVTAAQVTVADNDTAGVTVAPRTASVTEGGSDDDYTVVLDSQPAGTVVVSVSGADAGVDVSVGPSALTFSPTTWNSARTVTVQAVDDHLVEGEEQVTLAHAVSGYGAVVSAGDVIVTITDDDRRPSAPRGLEAVARNEQVTLSWRAPFDSGSRPITRYEVRWKETSGGTFNAWTDVGTATGYVVQSLVNDTGYTFEVQAVNESELTGPAVSVDATPTERPPVVELSPGAELEEGDAVTLTITPPDSPYASNTTLTVALVSVAENRDVEPGPVAGSDYTVAVGDTELAPRYHPFDAAGELASGPQPHYALTLTAGELSTAVTLTAIDDQEPEGQEYAAIHVLKDGVELNGDTDGFRIAASDRRPEPASATVAGNTVTLTFSRGLRRIEDPGRNDEHPDDTWIPLAPEMYFTRFTGDEAPVLDEHNLAAPAPGQPEGQVASGFALRGNTVTLTFPDPVSASENVWIEYRQYSAYAPLGDGSGDPTVLRCGVSSSRCRAVTTCSALPPCRWPTPRPPRPTCRPTSR